MYSLRVSVDASRNGMVVVVVVGQLQHPLLCILCFQQMVSNFSQGILMFNEELGVFVVKVK